MSNVIFYDVTHLERELFASAFDDVALVSEEISLSNLDVDAEVVSIFVSSTLTEEMIEKMPRLKLIACRSTGFDNVPLQVARQRGITVVNVPAYGSHTVAEYTFAMLLGLARRLPQATTAAMQGRDDRAELEGMDLFGKTLGIIGAGHIGVNVAKIANGFGMHVVAYDKFPREELSHEYGFTYVDLDTLLATSQVVSLHAPFVPENRHLINAERIKKMQHGTLLVNTARGELVDNKALIEALQSKHLGGAALDVLEGEQLMRAGEEMALLRTEDAPAATLHRSLQVSVLRKLPNVIVTHHNAYNSREAVERINRTTIDNIKGFMAGKAENIVA